MDTVNEKRKEEAESDRQKLLAGELIGEGASGVGQDEEESDDEDLLYAGDDARSNLYNTGAKKKKPSAAQKQQQQQQQQAIHGIGGEDGGIPGSTDAAATNGTTTTTSRVSKEDKRSLPISEERAEFLKQLGCHIVRDSETKILGTDIVTPWGIEDVEYPNEEEDDDKNDNNKGMKKNGESKNTKKGKRTRTKKTPTTGESMVADIQYATIKFAKQFDIVELDAHGHVVDKGDNDFNPSKTWAGRRAGFEFKLGERGLGYYRTGKKEVVPSNRSY